MSRILFVTLPQPRGVVSVLVVPQLSGSLTAAGMDDWAARLAAATLEVVIDPGAATSATVLAPPDPEVFRSVFPADTRVEPFAAMRYTDTPKVERTASMLERIEATYSRSAKAVAQSGSAADAVVREELAEWNTPATPPVTGPVDDGEWIEPDFHRTVSLLREHPPILRALGLIFDVALPTGVPATGRMRVRWPANTLVTSPWTAFERTEIGVVPAASGDVAQGMVDVSTPDWSVGCVDVQGGAGRLQDAARAVITQGATATLPTLRSVGMSLIRADREAVLKRRAAASDGGAADLAEKTFRAEDLVLGYRVDIRRQGAAWRSLTARLSTYELNGHAVVTAATREEGQVKAQAVTRQADGELHADEVVVRWDGWSLAVPRTVAGTRSRNARQLPLPFELTADHAVEPGTLPALRFGEEYRMRIRVADLAGGGVDVDAPEADSGATDFTTYRRYEPVGAPELGLGDATMAPGEGIVELVIRSDRGIGVEAFSQAHPQYPRTVARSLTPPQTSLRIAEEHGRLDADDDRARAAVEIAATRGTIADPAAGGVLLRVRDLPGSVAVGASVDQDWGADWPLHEAKSLRLTELAPGQTRLVWLGPAGTVRLGPAEQLTLDVSSFFADQIALHFEIAQWLRELPATAITTGRHPMATPPLAVRFVHAVRKPLLDPSGTLLPTRPASATHAVLDPLVPALGIDVPSTGQVDISASWQEWADSPDQVAMKDTVPSVVVERGASTLPEIRHEFADSKHRRITYRVSAVSRFRSYFDADEDAEAFVARTTLPEVRIPSSAPPPRPIVRSVGPAFRWSGTDVEPGWQRLERVRTGGLVRVELDRPWYATGQGEQLAVLVWDGAGPPGADAAVTRTGRDGIRSTTRVLPFPPVSLFAGADGPIHRIGDVAAVPHDVWFGEDRWWADVAMPGLAAASYAPFVRLAVARYQADSILGAHLSDTVTTDPVPVQPDRTLIADREGASIRVTVQGAGPIAPANSVRAALERSTAAGADSELAKTGSIEAPSWVEIASTSGVLGAALPALVVPADGAAYRLVVRETEGITVDPGAVVPAELRERTVFLDVIPVI